MKGTDLNIKRHDALILANQIMLQWKEQYKADTNYHPTVNSHHNDSPQACVCLCRASVGNESLEGIYKATGRLKHVWAF